MKTVTEEFKAAHLTPSVIALKRVYYKRRYWSSTESKYVWEASWSEVPTREIVIVGSITGKLDTDKLNEFKISNLTLELLNDSAQWSKDNASGIFKADAQAPLGYEAFWTKFRVDEGTVLASGAEEYTTMFTGYATELQTDTEKDTVQITVQGPEVILTNVSAELSSTLVTDENAGTGDGATVAFPLLNPGVGVIVSVKVNGVAKVAGTDYDVSNLNEPTLVPTITFTVAPANGHAILASYRYWKQDQRVEDLVEDLVSVAGIPAAQTQIDPVLFPIGVAQTFIADSQVDWLSGSFYKMTANSHAGLMALDYNEQAQRTLLDNFDDGNFTANPPWTAPFAGWSISGNALRSNTVGGGNPLKTENKRFNGAWQLDVRASSVDASISVYFATSFISSTGSVQDTYHFNWFGTGSVIRLFRTLGNTTNTILASTSRALDLASHNIRMTRSPQGRIRIYLDAILLFDVIDNAITLTNYFAFEGSVPNSGEYVEFDNIFVPDVSGEYTSKTFDALGIPLAWGKLVATEDKASESITYYTRVSSDGTTWDSWLPIASNGQIQSALKRYIEFKIIFVQNAVNNSFPYVDRVVINYSAAATLIKMANYTDKTIYQAIQALGSFANYEWGFTPDEIFFFRSKSVDTNIDEELSSDRNVISVNSIINGYDRVYTKVKATYGQFSVVREDEGLSASAPAARFLKRTLEIDNADILLEDDTDVATGITQIFYDYYSVPRRRMKARTKLLPWLDLADTVSLQFQQAGQQAQWYLGDTSVYLGQTDIYLYSDVGGVVGSDFLAKIVGYRHDMEQHVSEFDLEEVIAP